VEEIHRWKDDDVTLEVFSRVRDKITKLDFDIHSILLGGEMLEVAAYKNAAMQELKEFLQITDDMIDDLKKGE
jgi:hypothetical protein